MNIQRIGVVGAGTMGHGIAQVCAMAGFQVTLIDQNQASLTRGLEKIYANLDTGVAKGKILANTAKQTLGNISVSQGLVDLKDSDLIIEAVIEDLRVKCDLFQKLNSIAPRHAILATNTSSLSVTEIAKFSSRPENMLGLHFFNPVHIMKLLEIVVTPKTSNETQYCAELLGNRLGKITIKVNDSPGFATSRLGICLGNEAMHMLEGNVASAEDIDTAMTLGYGHPVGPLKLSDIIGLDVRLAITHYLYEQFRRDTFKPPRILEEMVEKGLLGKKSGQGFYEWKNS